MFIVTLRWDDHETKTTSFYYYESALSHLNRLIKESEKLRAKGFIEEYSVKLKKES